MGLEPRNQTYTNLWTDNEDGVPCARKGILGATIRRIMTHGKGGVIVALGKRVSGELARRGIVHIALVHPAARGRIRKRERYCAHVREALMPALAMTT